MATRTPKYDRAYDYLDTWAKLTGCSSSCGARYDPLVTKGEFRQEEFFAAQRDMLAHFKKRYPKIQYIEVENEPATSARTIRSTA